VRSHRNPKRCPQLSFNRSHLCRASLANVRFVLCGQQRPPQDRDWEIYIQTAALSPLGLDDIVAYLAKRIPALEESARVPSAKFILELTKGLPVNVAASVDGFLKSEK